MNNHLIIGLGGTGGKIIRAFRKTIYQEFRSYKPRGVAIEYLYMDSSPEMMSLNDPSWKVLGTSVQLGQNNQLRITGADLNGVIENVQNFPGIRSWIGDRSQWRDILNGLVTVAAAGAKRRLGRFLFANHVEQFNNQLITLVNSLQQESNTADVTFHICCGLAGGTGSGSLIDVISQIRSNSAYSDPGEYRILLYTLLPDSNPPVGWDTGNYHANGYAALMDLNAFSVGRYAPHDLSGKRDRLAELKDPFNGCYVFTNENENGMKVDVARDLPNIVADFLYQKIVAIQDIEHWDALRRIENAENGDGSPEMEPGSDLPARSKRFLTFGIKRLAVPEEEILEYMTHSFTSQAALQLLYNNWVDMSGFVMETRNQDFMELVKQPETQLKWKMSDDHLCLSSGILQGDIDNRKWKPIDAEWRDFITNSKSLIRDGKKEVWLDELGKTCQERFADGYRGIGVAAFYKAKRQARRDMAREIVRGIEAELFSEWRNGAKSMHDAARLVQDLITATQDRLRSVDDRIDRLKARQEKAEQGITENKRAWANIGLLGSMLMKKRENAFDAHGNFLEEYYRSRTWAEAWGFARELLQELDMELNDLKSELDRGASTISQAYETFQALMASRCNDDVEGGAANPQERFKKRLQNHLVRFYEPELVKEVCNRFVRDENVQRTQTQQVRASLTAKLGENPSFRAFNDRISPMVFMDTLEHVCEQSAKVAHDNLIQNSRERLLGVNIIERMKNQYGVDRQALRTYVSNLVKYAGNYIAFSDMEKVKRGPGIPDVPTCASSFTVLIPRAPEHSEFVSVLKDTFTESHRMGVGFIETDHKPNEITLVSVTNLFPLRFLKPLDSLRDKYEARINGGNGTRAKLELHIEGDGTGHPPLFLETEEEVLKRVMPYFLMARNMGIIEQRKNGRTGLNELVMIMMGEDGYEKDPVFLGRSLADAPNQLGNATIANIIVFEVERLLKSDAYLHADQRDALNEAVRINVMAIRSEHGPDSKLYQLFLEGGRKAAALLKPEN